MFSVLVVGGVEVERGFIYSVFGDFLDFMGEILGDLLIVVCDFLEEVSVDGGGGVLFLIFFLLVYLNVLGLLLL